MSERPMIGGLPVNHHAAESFFIRIVATCSEKADRAVLLAEVGDEYVIYTAWMTPDGTAWQVENGRYILKNVMFDDGMLTSWGRASEVYAYRRDSLFFGGQPYDESFFASPTNSI